MFSGWKSEELIVQALCGDCVDRKEFSSDSRYWEAVYQ